MKRESLHTSGTSLQAPCHARDQSTLHIATSYKVAMTSLTVFDPKKVFTEVIKPGTVTSKVMLPRFPNLTKNASYASETVRAIQTHNVISSTHIMHVP